MTTLQHDAPPVSAPRTEPVEACPLCRTRSAPVFFRAPDRQHDVPGEFTYRRCAECGTVFQDPRVLDEDLALCYPSEYLTHAEPPEAAPDWPGVLAPNSWKQRVRRAIVAGANGQRPRGVVGVLGRVLATTRSIRERANFGLLDELMPWRTGPMRALDAGCGAGGLLVRLTQVGWNAEGVEIDPGAVDVARRISGLSVRVGDFRTVDLPTGGL